MLRFYPGVLLSCIREWAICWYYMNTFFYLWLESGQHVDLLLICSFMLDSRVVNMLKFYECVLLFGTWEWSTCCDSVNVFFYVGLESGQHVDVLPRCSIALASRVVNMLRFYEYVPSFGLESGQHGDIQMFFVYSRVVNMLRFYPCFLLPWIRELSTCWYPNEYVQFLWFREWWTCWDSPNLSYDFGRESGQHAEILPLFSIALDSSVVNMLRL